MRTAVRRCFRRIESVHGVHARMYNDDMRGLPVTRLTLEVTDSLSNIFTVIYRSAFVRQGAASQPSAAHAAQTTTGAAASPGATK